MSKHEFGASSRPPQALSSRKGRSAPILASPLPRGRPRKETPLPSFDAELCAAAEKSQRGFQNVFGENLKAARLKVGLTQAEIAALTGLTQQYLSLLEAGQKNVTIRTMTLLAKVVKYDLLNLLSTAHPSGK